MSGVISQVVVGYFASCCLA